jgi:hypothetical protein
VMKSYAPANYGKNKIWNWIIVEIDAEVFWE